MRSDSGAVGGPGLGRGITYQVDAAIFYVLDLMSRVLTSAPDATDNRYIQIEPRHVEGEVVTRLDIFLGADNISLEAKTNPTDADVLDFLRTCGTQLSIRARADKLGCCMERLAL